MEGEESFDPSALGFAESVSQERVADDELIIIRVCMLFSALSVTVHS
jgi:T-complex protein 1 subunit alpha